MAFNSDPFGASHLESTKSQYKEIANFDDTELKEIAEHKVIPSVDFNAAQFMYFANYCQLFKRYENSDRTYQNTRDYCQQSTENTVEHFRTPRNTYKW